MSGPQPYLPALQHLMRLNPVDYQDDGTQAHIAALATALDDTAGRAYAAALARLIRYAPEDALLLIGQERRIRRFPGEPLEIYRRRVLGAWDYWRLAGTLPGMVLALKQAGYRASVQEHFRDPDREHWAEFSIRVSPLEKLPPSAQWDSTQTWDGGHFWDFQLPAVPLDWLVDIVREVKPAHARLRRLVFSPRGRHWDGDMTWDEGRTAPVPFVGYGIYTGMTPPISTEQTDSGPVWDAAEDTVIYDMEGRYA